jgi:hypothetical protein
MQTNSDACIASLQIIATFLTAGWPEENNYENYPESIW